MKGFFNKILYIDVARRTFREEVVPDSVYERFLGGKGFATHLLLENSEPGVDPLSPDNPIIFATGPVTDTKIWGSSRRWKCWRMRRMKTTPWMSVSKDQARNNVSPMKWSSPYIE